MHMAILKRLSHTVWNSAQGGDIKVNRKLACSRSSFSSGQSGVCLLCVYCLCVISLAISNNFPKEGAAQGSGVTASMSVDQLALMKELSEVDIGVLL